MRIKFLIKIQDKNTGKVYEAGEIAEFEDARAKELISDPRNVAEAAQVIKKEEITDEASEEEKPKKTFKRSKK